MSNIRTIPIKFIRLDGGTQARASMHDEAIQEYADALSEGVKFPPVTLFSDHDCYWLGDGFHRVAAAELAGKKSVLADIKEGGLRDARLYAIGANLTHGIRRTNADKRLAVSLLLDDPEWSAWSNRKVAEVAGVSPDLVDRLRAERLPETGNKCSNTNFPNTPTLPDSDHDPLDDGIPTRPGPKSAPERPKSALELVCDPGPETPEIPPAVPTAKHGQSPASADDRDARIAQLARLLKDKDEEIEGLRESLDAFAGIQEEMESMQRILDAEDLLRGFKAEVARSLELARVTKSRNDGLMNEVSGIKTWIKFWRGNYDSLRKRIQVEFNEVPETDLLRTKIEALLGRDEKKIAAKKKATTEEEEYNAAFGEAS